MGNAIPAGPVINSVSVWCANKRLRKQINPRANDAKERKKGRKEGKKEPERERDREACACVCGVRVRGWERRRERTLRKHKIIEYEFFLRLVNV